MIVFNRLTDQFGAAEDVHGLLFGFVFVGGGFPSELWAEAADGLDERQARSERTELGGVCDVKLDSPAECVGPFVKGGAEIQRAKPDAGKFLTF